MPISNGLKDAIEHAEGIRYIDGQPGNDENNPDYRCHDYREHEADVGLCRDVFDGTRRIRERKVEYLPKGPHELDDEYDARLKRATFHPAFEATARGLVGMVYRKDPVLLEPSDEIAEHAENIDLAGRPLSVFARDCSLDAIVDGHSWILVEYPRVPEGVVRSRADEMRMGLRPYWCQLKRQDVLNWHYDEVNGTQVLTLFTFRETVMRPKGAFGQEAVERVRVLRPGSFEVWEKAKTDKGVRWSVVDEGMTSLSYIPAVPMYANRTAPFVSIPPLLQLAFLNIEHYQKKSDHDFALKFAGSPMPLFTGAEATGVQWGANRALFLPDPEADGKLLESSGNSLEASRNDLQDIESRMASQGLQVLAREKRTAETAEAKRIDKTQGDSALAVMATGFEAALATALEYHADYIGQEATAVEINKDYRDGEIDPHMITALSMLVDKGQLPIEEMWARLKRGEVLPEDFDIEAALVGLDTEPPMLNG